ncbi:MAG: hypothetical protein ACRCRP_02750 [Metamycoplasmataceae bacterium]
MKSSENKKYFCQECNKEISEIEKYDGYVTGTFCSRYCLETWSLKADTCKCEDN